MQVHGGVCRWSWLTLPALPYDAPSAAAEGTNSEQRRDSRNRRRHEKGLYL